ncbi:hypothetical protein GCM10010442_37110 [Kitasatospora kifunensis]|uniref:Transposase IS116/IS110/IS902 C-terminal domain-containing protein n=1 Tax=Kitasatospora kifunensis TaxID=58351 RepID=A0A7W7VZN8_KITKI|nr:hypothetical protein [Kitasatospora kifunensis]
MALPADRGAVEGEARYFPALERAFDYSTSKAALVLLTGYRTPAALRRIGRARLAPVPRDSGRISGNMCRPHRDHRRLLRVFYLCAQVAARCCPTSRTFYERKSSEGKSHK